MCKFIDHLQDLLQETLIAEPLMCVTKTLNVDGHRGIEAKPENFDTSLK